MTLPNRPKGETKAVRDPEVEEREVDMLIVGGGMAACGAALSTIRIVWSSDIHFLTSKAAPQAARF